MDLEFRTIKILDIGYITIIYFILGLLISRLFDSYLGKFNKLNDDKKYLARVGAELIIMIWLIGAIVYLTRNVVELIPSPFDGLYGFKHLQMKELGSAAVLTMLVLSYTYHFAAKLDYFNHRINKVMGVPI
jgi:hypothetical protein